MLKISNKLLPFHKCPFLVAGALRRFYWMHTSLYNNFSSLKLLNKNFRMVIDMLIWVRLKVFEFLLGNLQ